VTSTFYVEKGLTKEFQMNTACTYSSGDKVFTIPEGQS